MTIITKPGYRALLGGGAAAALLVGSFLLGTTRNGAGAAVTVPARAGKITVTGTGTATGTPNQLVLTMGVQVNSFSVSSAVAQANRTTGRVIAALTARGVPKSHIQTADFSIEPTYRSGSQVPTGYAVSEQLTVTLSPLSRAGSQMQAAVTAGGNATTVDGVSLDLTDTGALLRSARANAVRDARAKALQFAAALGEHVTGVISVSEPSQQVYPVFGAALTGLQARAARPVPVRPGTQQVTAQVTVIFAIV